MLDKQLTDLKLQKFLTPRNPQAAKFYMYLLPKIHKPGNPGRSIVSSNDALTENISLFIGFSATMHNLITIIYSGHY